MRRVGLSVSLVTYLFIVGVVSSAEAQTQVLVPCCEGGVRDHRVCKTDEDCPGVCSGGFRDRRPCASVGCPNACVGGFDNGSACTGDGDCRSMCVGGQRDQQPCDPSGQPDCPGGSCSDAGSCTDLGECVAGACTGMCTKVGMKTKPNEPTSDWPTLPIEKEDLDTGPACP